MRLCTQDGCDNKHLARGYCSTHYNLLHAGDRRHPIYTRDCKHCGTQYSTKRHNGRFCSVSCSQQAPREVTGECLTCGQGFTARTHRAKYCTPKCRPSRSHTPKPRGSKPNPMRDAHDARDYPALLQAIAAHTYPNGQGCWVWGGKVHKDYPTVTWRKVQRGVHRLALEAKLGQSLGEQPAHHTCANTHCVNPDHLQLVTHRENTAEMLARNWMTKRIKELEQALQHLDEQHPLLHEVSLPHEEREENLAPLSR